MKRFVILTLHQILSGKSYQERSRSIKTDISSFERVEHFQYLGTALTNQNSIQEEIKSRLKSGNVCYRLVQNLPVCYPKI
jgi:cell fate (sporulation/competence/biofilm development) regulator YmcA (YheA/YmcA/DUF963 family)